METLSCVDQEIPVVQLCIVLHVNLNMIVVLRQSILVTRWKGESPWTSVEPEGVLSKYKFLWFRYLDLVVGPMLPKPSSWYLCKPMKFFSICDLTRYIYYCVF